MAESREKEYRRKMQAILSNSRSMRAALRNYKRMAPAEVTKRLSEGGYSTAGSHAERAERLFRAGAMVTGQVEGVPWYPDVDEMPALLQTESDNQPLLVADTSEFSDDDSDTNNEEVVIAVAPVNDVIEGAVCAAVIATTRAEDPIAPVSTQPRVEENVAVLSGPTAAGENNNRPPVLVAQTSGTISKTQVPNRTEVLLRQQGVESLERQMARLQAAYNQIEAEDRRLRPKRRIEPLEEEDVSPLGSLPTKNPVVRGTENPANRLVREPPPKVINVAPVPGNKRSQASVKPGNAPPPVNKDLETNVDPPTNKRLPRTDVSKLRAGKSRRAREDREHRRTDRSSSPGSMTDRTNRRRHVSRESRSSRDYDRRHSSRHSSRHTSPRHRHVRRRPGRGSSRESTLDSRRDRRHRERDSSSSDSQESDRYDDRRRRQTARHRTARHRHRRHRDSSESSYDSESDSSASSVDERDRYRQTRGRDGGMTKTLRDWAPKFSGREGRAVAENFLASMDDCLHCENLTDHRMIRLIACMLTDEAARWHRVKRREVYRWKEWKTAFRHRFIGEVRQRDVKTDLARRTQGVGESIAAYISCFKYVRDHLRRPPSRREQVEMVYEGLRPEYRNFMVGHSLHSLADIERYGLEYERHKDLNARWEPPPPKEKMKLPGSAFVPEGGEKKKDKAVAAIDPPGSGGNSAEGNSATGAKPQNNAGKGNNNRNKRGNNGKSNPPAGNQANSQGGNSSPVAQVQVTPPAEAVQNTAGGDGLRVGNQVWGGGNPPNNARSQPPQQYQAPGPREPQNNDRGASRRNGPPNMGPCFSCGVDGHWAANCPKTNCFECGQSGHRAASCPQRIARQVYCQLCNKEGVTVRECSNCNILQRLGNGAAGVQSNPLGPAK